MDGGHPALNACLRVQGLSCGEMNNAAEGGGLRGRGGGSCGAGPAAHRQSGERAEDSETGWRHAGPHCKGAMLSPRIRQTRRGKHSEGSPPPGAGGCRPSPRCFRHHPLHTHDICSVTAVHACDSTCHPESFILRCVTSLRKTPLHDPCV